MFHCTLSVSALFLLQFHGEIKDLYIFTNFLGSSFVFWHPCTSCALASRLLTVYDPPLTTAGLGRPLKKSLDGFDGWFLAIVNSLSRSLYAVARPFVYCLSVTFVHPTQPVEIFGNVSMPFGTLAIRWHPRKIVRISSQRNPSVGGGGLNAG